jgi:hypothetical protein
VQVGHVLREDRIEFVGQRLRLVRLGGSGCLSRVCREQEQHDQEGPKCVRTER